MQPEEIDHIKVIYGLYSAEYSGHTLGGGVIMHSRMPQDLEMRLDMSAFKQQFDAYGTDDRYFGHKLHASLGTRHGRWSYFIAANRLVNEGQPMSFGVTDSQGGPPSGNAVTGAYPYPEGGYIYSAQSTHVLDEANYATAHWRDEDTTIRLLGHSEGKTLTHAVFVENEWQLDDPWTLVLGARQEWWKAFDGSLAQDFGGARVRAKYPERSASRLSPKATLSYQPNSDWRATLSLGLAYRFPPDRLMSHCLAALSRSLFMLRFTAFLGAAGSNRSGMDQLRSDTRTAYAHY